MKRTAVEQSQDISLMFKKIKQEVEKRNSATVEGKVIE